MVGYETNRAARPPPVPSDFWSPMDSIGVRKSDLLIKEGNCLEHFDVEVAEPVPILSGRHRLARQLTDKLAATANQSTVYI